MSMDLINFVFGAATGVAGNTVYDSTKLILGSTFGKLETFARQDDKERFELVLQTVLETNEAIKQQLDDLLAQQPGTQTTVEIKGDIKAEKGSVAAAVIKDAPITITNTFGSNE